MTENIPSSIVEKVQKVNESFANANESMAKLNHTLRKGQRLDELRSRAEHFTTPSWQRPFHRLRVRYFLWRHYRGIDE